MNKAQKVGLSFGLTSATITTLGLIIGLNVGTGSRLAVSAGVIAIAISDSFSDALGVHLAKESEGNFTKSEIREATVSTFLYKFFFALSFLVPILLLNSPWSLYVALAWGVIILISLNYFIAKSNGEKPFKIIVEHLLISILVMGLSWVSGIAISHFIK